MGGARPTNVFCILSEGGVIKKHNEFSYPLKSDIRPCSSAWPE